MENEKKDETEKEAEPETPTATGLTPSAERVLSEHASQAINRLQKTLFGQQHADFNEALAYLQALGRGYAKLRYDNSLLLAYLAAKGKTDDFAGWLQNEARKAKAESEKKEGKKA